VCYGEFFVDERKHARVCLLVGYRGLNMDFESQYVTCMVGFLAGSWIANTSYFVVSLCADKRIIASFFLCTLYWAIFTSIFHIGPQSSLGLGVRSLQALYPCRGRSE
jgi:hypothetical protein